MLFKPAYCLLVLCALVPLVASIPAPVCKPGTGVPDGMNPYSQNTKPSDCKPCAVSGCQYCLENYKKCETCAAGTGLNTDKSQCVKCSTPDCGVCNDNYKKCDAKIAKCSNAPVKTPAATSKAGTYAPDDGFKYCQKEPGFSGSGYSSMFTGAVVNGSCIDCNGENFRPYSEGGVSFCVFDKRGREVAAMAFKRNPGAIACKYPSTVTFELKRTCVAQSGTRPFFINLVYATRYCGVEKTVIAAGGGFYKEKGDGYVAVVDPATKWEYIVQP